MFLFTLERRDTSFYLGINSRVWQGFTSISSNKRQSPVQFTFKTSLPPATSSFPSLHLMLICGHQVPNRTASSTLSDNSTWDFSAQGYKPINSVPFEAPAPLTPMKIKLESERRVWASILKVVSLGLVVLAVAELLSVILLPRSEETWVLWVACAVISSCTVIAAGLGMRAAWNMSAVSARCYLHYLIAFSGIFVMLLVLISMMIIHSEVLNSAPKTMPSKKKEDNQPSALLGVRLMLGMIVLVLATICMCSLLVYCALGLFKTAEACESISQLPELTADNPQQRETLD